MQPSILFSFAHPDDESFASAGTAMMYGAAGVRTVLVTATRGERGKAGNPPVCAPEELAACREQELREAARIDRLDERPGVDFVLDVSPWRDRRAAALRAHRSQHLSIDRLFFNEPDVDRILGVETVRGAIVSAEFQEDRCVETSGSPSWLRPL